MEPQISSIRAKGKANSIYFTAIITKYSPTHLHFIDRYGKKYILAWSEIEEVKEVDNNVWKEKAAATGTGNNRGEDSTQRPE